MDVTLVLLALVVLLVTWLWSQRKPSYLPPGYPSLPIVGSLFSMPDKQFHLLFMEMYEKFGPISSFTMGSRHAVVLNGYDVIRDALVNHQVDFASRAEPTSSPRLKYFSPNFPLMGIADSQYSEEWKRQRSTLVQILRRLGLSKRSIQLKIQEETRYIVEEIMSHEGKPFDPCLTLTLAVSNILCALVYGERYDTSDAEFMKLHHTVKGAVRLFFEESIGDFVWPYRFKSSYQKIISDLKVVCNTLNGFNKRKVDERKRRIEEVGFSDEPADLIEAYLKELQEGTTSPGKIQQNWLPGLINDFFLAGAETVSVAATWALLYLADRQDVQAKCQEELDRVLGSEPKDVDVELRSKCPYTEATIVETVRLRTIFPTGLVHATSKDVNFRGYNLPKDTWVFINLYSALMDPKAFPEPDTLKPERFLDANGEFNRIDHWIPFSMGRRSCAGEQLSRQQLFIYIGTLLHRFKITLPRGAKPDFTSAEEFMQKPHPYQVIFESRL